MRIKVNPVKYQKTEKCPDIKWMELGDGGFMFQAEDMSRWSLLKAAALDKERDTSSSSSIHRFSGFGLVAKKKQIWPGFKLWILNDSGLQSQCERYMELMDTNECLVQIPLDRWKPEYANMPNLRVQSSTGDHISAYVQHASLISSLPQCEYWRYDIPKSSTTGASFTVFTREKPRHSGLNVKALLSNKLHNVDNTGNVCVWPAEPLLLHTLLNVDRYRSMLENKRVLEIGGGMTAMAGLGLAVTGIAHSVTVTDGHPDCVKNQHVCIAMTRQKLQEQARAAVATTEDSIPADTAQGDNAKDIFHISAHQLHWSPCSNAAQVSDITRGGVEQFDVVIASDCLFFRDFHADLLETLRQVLRPGGVGIFLQPARDGTMRQFIERCGQTGYFATEVHENYNPEVTALRTEYLSKQQELGYSEDIHYPLMLVLRALH